MNFDQAFTTLIDPAHEGGFQNNHDDRGNWTGGAVGVGQLKGTKYGISAKSYPSEDIVNLTVDRAKFLYQRDYWIPAHCDNLPDALRYEVFDAAVNSGVGQALEWLQMSMAPAYSGKIDGVWGDKSQSALDSWSAQVYRLLTHFYGHRLDFLNNNPTFWATNGRGLTQRIATDMINA